MEEIGEVLRVDELGNLRWGVIWKEKKGRMKEEGGGVEVKVLDERK